MLHIIEPNMRYNNGHYASFVLSLVDAASKLPNPNINVWISKVSTHDSPYSCVVYKKYFDRKRKRRQMLGLIRNLLQSEDKIFLSTANIKDFLLIAISQFRQIKPNRVYFYVHYYYLHWFSNFVIETVAKLQPNIVILTPLDEITDYFTRFGFNNVRTAPYPIKKIAVVKPKAAFSHVLIPSIPRPDKGFDIVEKVISLSLSNKFGYEFMFQHETISRLHKDVRQNVRDIVSIESEKIKFMPTDIDEEEYLSLYSGAICLQFHNPELFRYRISGIILDALSNGAPLITFSDTWGGRIVDEYQAGITIHQDINIESKVLDAIKKIANNYDQYRDNANNAWDSLREIHDSHHLLNAIVNN